MAERHSENIKKAWILDCMFKKWICPILLAISYCISYMRGKNVSVVFDFVFLLDCNW